MEGARLGWCGLIIVAVFYCGMCNNGVLGGEIEIETRTSAAVTFMDDDDGIPP